MSPVKTAALPLNEGHLMSVDPQGGAVPEALRANCGHHIGFPWSPRSVVAFIQRDAVLSTNPIQLMAHHYAISMVARIASRKTKTVGVEIHKLAKVISTLGASFAGRREERMIGSIYAGILGRICEEDPPSSYNRFDSQNLLGASLLGQAKYAEAEPLLRAGYEGIKDREATLSASKKIHLVETGDSSKPGA